ncbi:MAG: amino acid permease [Methylovirgula sp.]
MAGLCYAELSSTVPVAGSAYTYAYATMGEFVAWMIGWDLILEYALGSTTVAIGWSGYVTSFLKRHRPAYTFNLRQRALHVDPISGHWSHTGAIFNFPAAFVIVLMSALLVVGIRDSAESK